MTESREWTAVRSAGPGGGVRLRVTGVCIFPTSGWAVELRRHDPQGADDELLLELIVEEPTGPVLQVISPVPVAYEEPTTTRVRRVSIAPDGPEGLDVEESGYPGPSRRSSAQSIP